MDKSKLKILVLMGGNSVERDVSIATGRCIVDALKAKGHDVVAIDTAHGTHQFEGNQELLAAGVKTEPPETNELQKIDTLSTLDSVRLPAVNETDLVFIALHGGQGEDGTIQALLDIVGVPYTGSGHLSSALAMDKLMSKKIFQQLGIRTPKWIAHDAGESDSKEALSRIKNYFGFPVVVKPSNQGSTVGITVVRKENDLPAAIDKASQYTNELIIEEYIEGREITVAILGEEPLPVIEIHPEHGIYDYECKYTKGRSRYTCPAELSEAETKQAQEMALEAFKGLKCEDYARADFRFGTDGKFYLLEVNTLPGMTDLSLVPMAAKAAGIEFPDLIERIARLALENKKR